MGVLSSLMRNFAAKVSGNRSWTPAEVRDLLDRQQIDAAFEAVGALAADTPDRAIVESCLRGEVAFRRHEDTEAERLFREVLALAPGLADAHYGLSLVMLARGEAEAAVRHAQFAANAGTAARFSAQLGLCQLELGNVGRAGESLRRATRLDPNDKSSWNNLGIARRSHGDLRGARAAFARALELDPVFEAADANARRLDMELDQRGAEVKVNETSETADVDGDDMRIAALRRMAANGDLAGAIDQCESMCSEAPDEALLVIELTSLYREYGDVQSGLDALEAFLACHPDDMDGVAALGQALVKNAEFVRAKPLVQRALDARPDDIPLLLAMADIRFQQERYLDAGALLERAFELTPTIHMKGRLASNLIARCRYDEGLALIDEMLAEDPAVERDALPLQIMALTYQGRHEEVLPKLNALIDRTPNDPHRRFARASINLLKENFAEGWDDYAFRNLESTRHLRMLPFSQWDGGPLDGKTIVVAAEQGLGDQVMFASCLPDLLRMNPGRVIVETIDRVAPTIARSFPQCEVIATKQDKRLEWVRDIGHVDCFTLMGDLPQVFRRAREDFPDHRGYLVADPERIAHWRQALIEIDGGTKPRIGVSWRGGTESTRTSLRSIDVLDFGGLFKTIDATWVCLQYADVAADLRRAADAGMPMQYWPAAIKDLDEFAALIMGLDKVVTVCNTTVHYAGALGKPVFVLAPQVPEWRYGLTANRMPWYPSSRVYRQPTAGDWSGVLRRVAEDLGRP